MNDAKLCECGCGNPAPIAKQNYKRLGHVKGQPVRFIAGHHAKVKHGHARKSVGGVTAEYWAYHDARKRCANPQNKQWKDYGGRGICFLFTSFEEFFAHIGPRPSAKHSLDRINNDSHYMPGNVKWSTMAEQAANKRGWNKRGGRKAA